MWGEQAATTTRVRPYSLDVLFDQVLSQAGAHELVVAGNDDVFLFSGPSGHILHIHDFGDIGAAMADVNANSFTHR